MSPILDYRSPAETPRNASTPLYTFVLYQICTAAILLVVTAMSLVVNLRFEKVFKDFKMDLPEVTKLALTFSRPLVLVVLWLLSPLPGVIAMAIRSTRTPDRYPPRRPWTAVTVMFLLLTLVTIAYAVAVMAPMVSLIQNISGPKK